MNKISTTEKSRMIGTFCHLGSTTAAECLSLTNLDYIIIDMEHMPYDDQQISEMIRAIKLHNKKVYIRVRELSRGSVLRCLDSGADGIIVPNIHTVDEVKQLVQYAKYPPTGERGFAFTQSCNYGSLSDLISLNDYFLKTNNQIQVIPQIETEEAYRQVDNIISLDGVDAIFIGPYDLSISLGVPAQLDSPILKKAINTILNASIKNRKKSWIFAGSTSQSKTYFDMGFDYVAISTDTSQLINSYNTLITDITI